MNDRRSGNGIWRAIALAFLAALLSGGGAAMLVGWQRVAPLEQRVAAQEQGQEDLKDRLDRIEAKLDQLLERRKP